MKPAEERTANDAIKIDKHFTDAFLWKSLGKAYEAIGNVDAAKIIYDAAIQRYSEALSDTSPNYLRFQSNEPDILSGYFEVFEARRPMT